MHYTNSLPFQYMSKHIFTANEQTLVVNYYPVPFLTLLQMSKPHYQANEQTSSVKYRKASQSHISWANLVSQLLSKPWLIIIVNVQAGPLLTFLCMSKPYFQANEQTSTVKYKKISQWIYRLWANLICSLMSKPHQQKAVMQFYAPNHKQTYFHS